ncbi:MAG TPA: GIY-YIG nuclease family protein [Acidobacteriota bacterium]|jgi:putative endonuclease|nr:GIY-YIG nuclease family protein [Acidobacteriota bacterium]HQQ46813.1 GIY-YIG nuclease family protein [Acidobacteriota bacterium]
MAEKTCAVYILTNSTHRVLYTGVTSDLPKRVWQHKNKVCPDSFSAHYGVNKLVWFEVTSSINAAIEREKKIKAGSRQKKIILIEKMNPRWDDLSEKILRIG